MTLAKHYSWLSRSVAIAALVLQLSACESSLNRLRTNRFDTRPAPTAPSAEPRALALALRLGTDGQTLTSDSLRQANAMLNRQGRIAAQVLTITPFNTRGERFAPRLAQALTANGAAAPRIEPIPINVARIAQANTSGGDLELQSEALVLADDRCEISDPEQWTTHPFRGVGTLGCATRANLARMVSDPRDLNRPRTLSGSDGRAAAAAVSRYQQNEQTDLIDIDFDEK